MKKLLAIILILALINNSYQDCSGCNVFHFCNADDECELCPEN
jgi:hypothetical protein